MGAKDKLRAHFLKNIGRVMEVDELRRMLNMPAIRLGGM